MQPNFFATFSLAAYPLFTLLLFSVYRAPVAVALSLLIAEMVLPPFWMLPLSSPTWLGKATIPPLATFFIALMFSRSYMRRSRPLRGVEWFYVIMLFGAFMTMWTNRDPISYGPLTLPGETFGDFTSDAIRAFADPWIAFYLGRVMFKTSRDLVALCKMLALASAVYTLPALFEIRMSPKLQMMIYGFAPSHEFSQMVRWGGYRPRVLMGHGLVLTMFMFVCLVSALSLLRAKKLRINGIPMRPLCLYLTAVLVLCKSTGAIIYAAFTIPIVMFGSARTMLRIASVMAVIFVAYPVLRFADVIPMKQISDDFTSVSADRAQSLSYRFEMEQGVLELTQQRPWFGMGGYSRNFTYDPKSGKPQTVLDGMVIITLSGRGLVGFLCYFGPCVVSVLRADRLTRRVRDRSIRFLLSGLALACAFILFDMILNSTFPPIFMLLMGALYGLPGGVIAEEQAAAEAALELGELRVVAG